MDVEKIVKGVESVFSCDEGGLIVKWDAKTGDKLVEYGKAHDHPIFMMVLHKDGKLLLTADEDGNIKLWDATSNSTKPIHDYGKAHDGIIDAMAFSAKGKYFWSTGQGIMKKWLIFTKANCFAYEKSLLLTYPKPHHGARLSYMITSQEFLWTIDTLGRMKTFPIETPTEWKGPKQSMAVNMSLLAICAHKEIKGGHASGVYAMAVTRSDKWLFSGDQFGYQMQWDVNEQELAKNYRDIAKGCLIDSIVLTHDDRFQWISNDGGSLIRVNVEKMSALDTYDNVMIGGITSVCLTAENNLWMSNKEGDLMIWDTKTHSIFKEVEKYHKNVIPKITISLME